MGFEVFEFVEPKTVAVTEFEYTRGGQCCLSGLILTTLLIHETGFFHIAVTVADPKAVAAKAVGLGGKQIGETIAMYGE